MPLEVFNRMRSLPSLIKLGRTGMVNKLAESTDCRLACIRNAYLEWTFMATLITTDCCLEEVLSICTATVYFERFVSLNNCVCNGIYPFFQALEYHANAEAW
jgi:hypothetical protein